MRRNSQDEDLRALERAAKTGGDAEYARYLVALRRAGRGLQPWEGAWLRKYDGEDVAPWELSRVAYTFVEAYVRAHPDENYVAGHGVNEGRVRITTDLGSEDWFVVSHVYPYTEIAVWADNLAPLCERYGLSRGAGVVALNAKLHLEGVAQARAAGKIVLTGRYPTGHGPSHGETCYCFAMQHTVLGLGRRSIDNRSHRVVDLIPSGYDDGTVTITIMQRGPGGRWTVPRGNPYVDPERQRQHDLEYRKRRPEIYSGAAARRRARFRSMGLCECGREREDPERKTCRVCRIRTSSGDRPRQVKRVEEVLRTRAWRESMIDQRRCIRCADELLPGWGKKTCEVCLKKQAETRPSRRDPTKQRERERLCEDCGVPLPPEREFVCWQCSGGLDR